MDYRKHSYGHATQVPCKTCGAVANEACGHDPAVPMDIHAIALKLTRLDAFVVLRALAGTLDDADRTACEWITQRLQVGVQAAGWTFVGVDKTEGATE